MTNILPMLRRIESRREVQSGVLQRPARIRLLTDALLPYRWAPEPVPVTLELLPDWTLTHANHLAWMALASLLASERVNPPEAWELEQQQGSDPTDPGHWVAMARNGLERASQLPGGKMSAGQVINIAPRTLVFGGRAR